jgi:hypothetical protein
MNKLYFLEPDPLLSSHAKNNSKWNKYLNIRPATFKLLEENTGKTLENIGRGNIF